MNDNLLNALLATSKSAGQYNNDMTAMRDKARAEEAAHYDEQFRLDPMKLIGGAGRALMGDVGGGISDMVGGLANKRAVNKLGEGKDLGADSSMAALGKTGGDWLTKLLSGMGGQVQPPSSIA